MPLRGGTLKGVPSGADGNKDIKGRRACSVILYEPSLSVIVIMAKCNDI